MQAAKPESTHMLHIPKAYWITAIAAALLALIAMSPFGQGAQILMLVSVIGIPLALALMATPTLAFYLLLGLPALALANQLPWPAHKRWLVAVGLVAIIGIVPAQLANLTLARRSAALLAADRSFSGQLHFSAPVIWHRNPNDPGRQRLCDALCLHLLAGHGAKRVFMLTDPGLSGVPSPEMQVPVFWFEAAESCSSSGLFQQGSRLVAAVGIAFESVATADELVQRASENGQCLRAGRARLGEADVIFALETFGTSERHVEQSLKVDADTLGARRMSLYQRNASGFVETARRTIVWSYRHPIAITPVLHSPLIDVGEKGRLGFFRRYVSSFGALGSYYRPTLEEFLVKDLRIRL